jgi:hypothetical protein
MTGTGVLTRPLFSWHNISINTDIMNSLQRLEFILSTTYSNQRHLETAADQVYMSCLRTGVDLVNLLDNIQSNNVFDAYNFSKEVSGNVFDHINKEFRECVMRFVDITAGGNGGMASIGRGEFMISFASNFQAKISKSGKGDLEYVKTLINEEVKWNGGKINVSDTQGKEVFSSFLSILKKNGEISLIDKDFVPFRKKNIKTYTTDVINILNARFWQAITGETFKSVTDVELKKLCLCRAFNLTFSKSDSILIVNEDGKFVRFKNAENAVEYYNNKIDDVELEIRAKQTNPIAIYLFV